MKIFIFLVLITNLAFADNKGLEIAKETESRDSGWVNFTANMKMILTDRKGRSAIREIRTKNLEVQGDGDKSMSIFDTPRDIKGTAMLTFSHKLNVDDQWLYLPALKRVKRISSRNKSGPFMGSEFAQIEEWQFRKELSWELLKSSGHKGMQKFVRDLNFIYLEKTPLYELDYDYSGFQWIDCNDSTNSVISFLRRDKNGNYLIFVFNFTPIVRYDYKIGVPDKTLYKEIFNSDSFFYGGSNVGNLGQVLAISGWYHNFPQHVNITLPPLGFIVLERIME